MVLEKDFPMIEVSIPSIEKKVDESGKSKKLRKIIRTPDFPSKRNPHLRTKPVEQRRQELEDYIQEIICQNEDVPQVLLDFLHVKHFHTGNKMSSMESLELDSQDYSYQLSHKKVVGYFQDPYLCDCTSGLPDVVVDGVLQGFYPRDIRVSFTVSTLTETDPTTSIDA
uniref:sorting nexin-22 isoform X2 n=1 Tax=Monopterus albus TaxID=43700 RepID=UPI0009B3A8D3|nr:sorting nexin-22-like isoform X2 [Monopterus albus]